MDLTREPSHYMLESYAKKLHTYTHKSEFYIKKVLQHFSFCVSLRNVLLVSQFEPNSSTVSGNSQQPYCLFTFCHHFNWQCSKLSRPPLRAAAGPSFTACCQEAAMLWGEVEMEPLCLWNFAGQVRFLEGQQ